ncbi:hypothetical protein B0H14DRAFT_2769281 [Mycena olivaceomarginata]|nr:hypothetical protein B0H14DRAFT_2769281 [Mycena olivaceomarginata]
MSCPICQVEKGAKSREINDATARLVLGESNMDEWNQARFWSTLSLLPCPHEGCNHSFDVEDAIPSRDWESPTCVQCPHCKGLMCKTCKSVWHEDMTCLMYQDLRRNEEVPRVVHKKRHREWPLILHTQSPNKYDADTDSPGSMYSAGSVQSSASTYSFSQGPSSSYDSPRNLRGPPWTPEKQSFFYAS